MTNLDTTWLCALLLASGKVSAREVTPGDLENFDAFIESKSRLQLAALEDAVEFAWDMMADVEGDHCAIEIAEQLSVMLGRVRAAILNDREIMDYYKMLVKQ